MSLRPRLLIALLVSLTIGITIVDVLTCTLVSRSQLDQIDQDLERVHPPIERAGAQPVADRERAIREPTSVAGGESRTEPYDASAAAFAVIVWPPRLVRARRS